MFPTHVEHPVGPGVADIPQVMSTPVVLDGILTHSFETVESMLQACAYGLQRDRHQIANSAAEWLGVKSPEDAFSLARTGWEDGADKARALFTSLESQMAKSLIPVLTCADEPGTFDPANYYAGEEQYFLGHSPSDSTAEGRPEAITIYYDSFVSGAISAQNQMRRGTTVAALAYILERSGLATSIYLSSRSKVSGVGGAHTDEVLFRVKAFGQPIVLPHVAFWLGHPCVDRLIVSGGILSPWHRSDSYAPGPKREEKADTVVIEPFVHGVDFNPERYLREQLKRFKLLNVEMGS